jgi:hypothetical protein
METLPREMADEIIEHAIDECSAADLLAFTTVNRKRGWHAQKRLYAVVDIRCMERVIVFLTTLSSEEAGLEFGKEPGYMPRYNLDKLQFSFDVRFYPSTTQATFKNLLATMIRLVLLKEFTFWFSEVDPLAFRLMTGVDIKFMIKSLRMISIEAQFGLVSPHFYCPL